MNGWNPQALNCPRKRGTPLTSVVAFDREVANIGTTNPGECDQLGAAMPAFMVLSAEVRSGEPICIEAN